jgi:hypothetical protein
MNSLGRSVSRLNLVFLDSCRNNPFAALTRLVGRGLVVMPVTNVSARGTFVSYSTAPGSVAEDGSGRNSPYSEALVRHIKEPGLLLEQVLRRVRSDVPRGTDNRQRPWDQSSLEGDFYFVPPTLAPSPTTAPPQVAVTEPPMPAPSPATAPQVAVGVYPTPGSKFRDCADCPELIVVPAGSFEMGSPPGEESRYGY